MFNYSVSIWITTNLKYHESYNTPPALSQIWFQNKHKHKTFLNSTRWISLRQKYIKLFQYLVMPWIYIICTSNYSHQSPTTTTVVLLLMCLCVRRCGLFCTRPQHYLNAPRATALSSMPTRFTSHSIMIMCIVAVGIHMVLHGIYWGVALLLWVWPPFGLVFERRVAGIWCLLFARRKLNTDYNSI